MQSQRIAPPLDLHITIIPDACEPSPAYVALWRRLLARLPSTSRVVPSENLEQLPVQREVAERERVGDHAQ